MMLRAGIFLVSALSAWHVTNAASASDRSSQYLSSQLEKAGFSKVQNDCFVDRISAVLGSRDVSTLASSLSNQIRSTKSGEGTSQQIVVATKVIFALKVLGAGSADQSSQQALTELADRLQAECMPLFEEADVKSELN